MASVENYRNRLSNTVAKLSTVRKDVFYLTMHSAHFIYGHMAWDIW